MSNLALHGGEPIRTEGPTASWPVVGDLEIQHLTDVIDSGDLLYGRGKHGVKFEEELAEWMGAGHAIGTINGTETMALALKAAGIGPGDEVIMPAMTFIACPQSVLLANAIPVLVDLTAHNVALDPELVEAAITDNTKAIMAVDLYGVAADMDAIMDIADRHDLFLLEDCAQAQGTEWRGKKLGTLGDAGSLSFHTAKCITSGDGGAVVTDSKELRDLMQSYRQFGQPFAGAEHDFGVTGGNYRMSEFVAACLRAQIQRIDELMAKRNESAAILDEMLADIPVISPLEFPEQVTARSYLNYVIFYDQQAAGGVHRDIFRKAVAAEGGAINLGYTYMLTDRAPLGGPVRERDKDRFFGRRIDYESLEFPVARTLIDNTMMNIHQRWLLSDEETVRDLGRAIQKVAENVEDLRDETLEE